eukprot:Sspe_Gene.27555::Locus_11945_Transcript_1_3_Confidence_0.750_Length_420::g.27555::m.27555
MKTTGGDAGKLAGKRPLADLWLLPNERSKTAIVGHHTTITINTGNPQQLATPLSPKDRSKPPVKKTGKREAKIPIGSVPLPEGRRCKVKSSSPIIPLALPPSSLHFAAPFIVFSSP